MNLINLISKNKDFLLLAFTLIADRLLGFVIIFYLVRLVADDLFAFWTQLNFLPGVLCGVIALGLGNGVLRLFIDNKISKKIISKLINIISFLFLSLTSLTYISIVAFASSDTQIFLGGTSATDKGILILFFFILIEGLFEIFLNYLRAKISPRYLTFLLLRIVPRLIFAFSIFILNYNFWTSLIIYIGGSFVLLLYLRFEVSFCINKYQSDTNINSKRLNDLVVNLVKYSFPVMIAGLSIPILNILVRGDIYRDYGYEVIGIFGIYMSFIGFLIYIPESFQNYIFPRFARSADTEIKQKNNIRKQFILYFLFSFSVCMLFVFIGPYVLEFLYPKSEWTFVDSALISITSLCWTTYYSLQRYFLVFYPLKNYLFTILSFLSLLIITFIDFEIFRGPASGVFVIAIFFILCSFMVIISLALLQKRGA